MKKYWKDEIKKIHLFFFHPDQERFTFSPAFDKLLIDVKIQNTPPHSFIS